MGICGIQKPSLVEEVTISLVEEKIYIESASPLEKKCVFFKLKNSNCSSLNSNPYLGHILHA